jgi:hypothetical protein
MAMLILLSDGAGLTARQCATLLARAGHRVEALSPDPLCLCRLTRHVRAVHQVPGLGDPFGWLDAALDIAARRGAEMLLPVQEQVSVMALAHDRIVAAGLLTAVPDFGALAQVQDKLSAYDTLARAGLPQPSASVAANRAELEACEMLPAFVKTPIGTASAGVRRVGSAAELRILAAQFERAGVFETGGVLVQEQVTGPLIMIQSVFAGGELVAFHACQRVHEGAGGGAGHKLGLRLPEAREHIARLGTLLGWHGALSADVILSAQGPLFIDINPRLVEPVNAYLSGTDLVGTLVEVARCGTARPRTSGTRDRQGVRTHQLLLAVLGAAEQGGRLAVARELRDALTRCGDYRGSTEELTPLRGDLRAAVPVTAAALATLVRPAMWRRFAGGAVSAYSLTPGGWHELTSASQEAGAPPRAR